MMDVTFFVRCAWTCLLIPLPTNATREQIMTAEAATLRISNQKNGHAGACIHYEAVEGNVHACPVRALGRRYCHIRANTKAGKTFLCAYWDRVGRGNISDQEIRVAVKAAASALKYPQRGMSLKRIDTHSLRSGGACALKLAGKDNVTIRKLGRWAPKSNTWLEYIQTQLSSFSKGLTSDMRNIPRFSIMEGAENREDMRPLTIFN